MSNQAGRGGMGSHKHGTSGHPTRSPRYKFMQTLEANQELEQRSRLRPKTRWFADIKALFSKRKP